MYSPLLNEIFEQCPALLSDAEEAGDRVSALQHAFKRLMEQMSMARAGKRRSQATSNWQKALHCIDTEKSKLLLPKVR